jgi:hypothetical protein
VNDRFKRLPLWQLEKEKAEQERKTARLREDYESAQSTLDRINAEIRQRRFS